jgi:YfiH family protein
MSRRKLARAVRPAHKRKSPGPRAARPALDAGKGWVLRDTAGIATLEASQLARVPWLTHAFSTRLDTACVKSPAPFNLGFTETDSRAAVTARRTRLAAVLGASAFPLIAAQQFHSDVVHVISGPHAPPRPPHADALITQTPGVLLAVQSADCVPILFADTRRRVIAAIHAGWRGTLARIAQKVLGKMRMEFGTRAVDVIAAIGPSIGPCCYEVGPEVAQSFAAQFPAAKNWFTGPFDRLSSGEDPNPLPWLNMMPPGHQPPPPRVQLDLRAANRWQLIDAGVAPSRISVSPLCTSCRTDLLFSYRREGRATGRQMSAIGIFQS